MSQEVVQPTTAEAPLWIQRIDAFFDRAGDWCNPILVKEARQALKSRQFIWTFAVLLLGAWIWSFAGTLLMMPGIYYVPGGRAMLLGYYWVLAVPMMLVAPMAANRSLVAEREDGTYEVLSITTLSSYQIILGKLASSVLQLVIYFTALVPCVAFTYILRGIDLPSIALLIASTFLTSVFMVVVGLFLASISNTRSLQSLLMIGMLLLVLLAEYLHGAFAMTLMTSGIRSDDSELLVLLLAIFTLYLVVSIFLIVASAASLSPVSENRSTRLRIMMLVLQGVAIFWALYLIMYSNDLGVRFSRSMFYDFFPGRGTGIVILVLSAFYWIAMGGLMLGESETLSARVRRGLPKTFLGRVLLTWLNPGPGTGMVFAISSFAGIVAAIYALEAWGVIHRVANNQSTVPLGMTLLGYMMFFLGITHLLVSLVRGKGSVTPFVSLVATLLMMSLGCIIPYSIGLYVNNFRSFTWDETQITNWAWTLRQFANGATAVSIPWMVLTMGLLAVAANLLYVGRDVMIRRVSTPQRVLDELAALNPMPESETPIDPLA
ncbi:ABC-2 family transporter protein [Rosistilla carotiformis]|uniref:ABC-2 family transporter protein n=1 Tax=Rosistilla carotiformis TaxID=2528017 RepID=A0A518JW71_9BACT|nr:ABC transporter permease [Rosistilla carotiformis]QDV69792.1 ABC-2 family transporter protein [Rosistilla carotiformis]